MIHGARTYETDWLGQLALVLETDGMRLVTVPGMGAKIVSLFDKRSNREWLLPPINRSFRPAAYGASFVEQDMSGWDEMFPTINACRYPVDGIYKGSALPDHGEVWSLAWQIEQMTDTLISLSTRGYALPYQLSRTVQMLDDQTVRLAYEAVNTGAEAMIALWASHPQFAVDQDTRIVLPASVKRVINVHPTADWSEVGRVYPWPEAESQKGDCLRLDHIAAPDPKNCRKFYVLPEERVNWAAIQQGGDGAWLRLSWNTAEVPYLGIWVDEGEYNPVSTVGLEPSTGYYDSLELAWQNQRVMEIAPHETVRWHLDIGVGAGPLER